MPVKHELLSRESVIDIPAGVRLCPYCGAKLRASFDWWTQQDDGSWMAESVDVSCVEEPDIDEDDWEDFWGNHSQMPYVYWMPAQTAVLEWVNKTYRFEVSE
jgi:hypothetical protein